MNRIVFPLAMIILQASHLAWGGSYLIQLKNGGEVRTSRYWEEGAEIKFSIYGGVAGIQKGFVNEIKEINLVLRHRFEKSRSDSGDEGKFKEGTKVERTDQDQSGNGGTQTQNNLIDSSYYQQQKQMIRQKMEEVTQAYEEASRKRDAEAKEQARQERAELSRRLIDLTEELKRQNDGVIPDWWR